MTGLPAAVVFTVMKSTSNVPRKTNTILPVAIMHWVFVFAWPLSINRFVQGIKNIFFSNSNALLKYDFNIIIRACITGYI